MPNLPHFQVIDSSIHGQYQGIYIKVNGIHRDNGEQVYMQVLESTLSFSPSTLN